MITANQARALMEKRFLDRVEDNIIKAATNRHSSIEIVEEGGKNPETVRSCLQEAGYDVEHTVIDKEQNISSWYISWGGANERD